MRIKLWNHMSFRLRHSMTNKRWMASIGKNGFNRQYWHNSVLVASVVVWAWLIDRTFHIHRFKFIGDTTGYVAARRCRCGREEVVDIYGLKDNQKAGKP